MQVYSAAHALNQVYIIDRQRGKSPCFPPHHHQRELRPPRVPFTSQTLLLFVYSEQIRRLAFRVSAPNTKYKSSANKNVTRGDFRECHCAPEKTRKQERRKIDEHKGLLFFPVGIRHIFTHTYILNFAQAPYLVFYLWFEFGLLQFDLEIFTNITELYTLYWVYIKCSIINYMIISRKKCNKIKCITNKFYWTVIISFYF